MTKKLVVQEIVKLANEAGFYAENADTINRRVEVVSAFRRAKNMLFAGGTVDHLLTPIVMSQVDDWMREMYEWVKQ